MQSINIGFIGGGNMAEALLAGLIRAGHRPDAIRVSDAQPGRIAELRGQYGVDVEAHNGPVAAGADVLVLAVKPQQMKAALAGLGAEIRAGTTVISIAAGVSLASLREYLGRQDLTIVRVMPNTPALVGAGMSVLFCEEEDGEHRRRAEYVLGASGDTAWVGQERMLHAVTAISGSGPAYFFLLAEMMAAAAIGLGLPEELAEKLVVRTAFGAGCMLAQTGRTPEQLRQQVTSPGGTTQAALDVMYDKGLPDIVRKAIGAAQKRSVELS
jgi:pyrroline-5-carboxylate reductase